MMTRPRKTTKTTRTTSRPSSLGKPGRRPVSRDRGPPRTGRPSVSRRSPALRRRLRMQWMSGRPAGLRRTLRTRSSLAVSRSRGARERVGRGVPETLGWGTIQEVNRSPAHVPGPVFLRDSRAVLFDLDGTLLDTIELILSSFRHATTVVLGRPLPDDVLRKNVGVPLAVQMREFDEDRAEELLAAYRVHNAEHHDELVQAFPGVRRGARPNTGGSGLPMGVVTSKSRLDGRARADHHGTSPTASTSWSRARTPTGTSRTPTRSPSRRRAGGRLALLCVRRRQPARRPRRASGRGPCGGRHVGRVLARRTCWPEGPDAVLDRMADLPDMLLQAPARAGA